MQERRFKRSNRCEEISSSFSSSFFSCLCVENAWYGIFLYRFIPFPYLFMHHISSICARERVFLEDFMHIASIFICVAVLSCLEYCTHYNRAYVMLPLLSHLFPFDFLSLSLSQPTTHARASAPTHTTGIFYINTRTQFNSISVCCLFYLDETEKKKL